MTTKLRQWASETSASENASPAGLNFAEGQLPSTVNNSIRAMMGQVRDWYDTEEAAWIEWSATCSVASQTTLKLAGDRTALLPQGRRLRFRGGAATVYATVLSASFTAETTITVEDKTGSLSASTSVVGFALAPLAMPRRVDKLDVSATLSVGFLTGSAGTFAINVLNAGSVSVSAGLFVGGTSVMNIVNVASLSVSAAAMFKGAVTIEGAVTVSANARFSTNIDVSATASAAFVKAGIANIGSLSVSAAAVFKGAVTIEGAVTVSANARFSTNLDVSATASAGMLRARNAWIGGNAITGGRVTSILSATTSAFVAFYAQLGDPTNVGLGVYSDISAQTGNMIELGTTATASTGFNYLRATGRSLDDEFKLRGDGNGTCDGSWTGGGADFAELREWADGNASATDRAGVSVVLVDGKITAAKLGDDPIGAVSVKPTVIGGNSLNWPAKWATDDFGREIYGVDGERIPNPAYDPTRQYVTRDLRPEWAAIGLLGFVPIRNDQPVSPRWVRSRVISDAVTEYLIR